jgi:glycosyltransferase involved in cell wall biosynthesis
MSRMKILFLQDTDWIKRNPHQQVHLAERMVQRGHEVRVIDYEILWHDEKKRELLSKKKVHFVSKVFPDVKIKLSRPSILKIPIIDYISMLFTYSREIKHQIKEFKPDVILSMDLLIAFLAYPLAKRNNLPVVYYTIDIDYRLIPYRFLQTLGRWIESWNIQHADLVLSINKGLQEYTIRMGAHPQKTMVLRAGIDLATYNPKVNGDEIRKKFGIKKDDKILFFMGWLYQFSGLKEVAIELSKIQDESIKLLIVGEGDAFQDLKKIREEYHLQDRIILAGQQPYKDIPQFIASADICLLPAYHNEIMRDIVPIKMYEYMAMGKPIISTKLPGIMKEFGNDHGVIYIEKPEDAMTNAMYLIEHNIIKMEGEKARKYVEHNDWQITTDEFERMLDECV